MTTVNQSTDPFSIRYSGQHAGQYAEHWPNAIMNPAQTGQSAIYSRCCQTGRSVALLGFLVLCILWPTPSVLAQEAKDAKLLSDPFANDNDWMYRDYVDAANRKLSHQLEGAQKEQAIADACQLYLQMKADPSVAESEFLTGRKRKLFAALRKVSSQLEREIRKSEKRAAEFGDISSRTESAPGTIAPSTIDPLGNPLANNATEGTSTNTAEAPNQATVSQTSEPIDTSMSISRSWEMAYQMESGPAQVFARAGGAVQGDPTQLIHLIQTTVTPNVWDVNGGTASIGYYPRVHTLVIRAPWTTHDSTQRLLKRFRE